MMYGAQVPPSRPSSLPRPGPATRAMLVALFALSLGGALLERRFGFGASSLVFFRPAVMDGQLWRLLSYGFVKVDSPLGLMLSGLALYLFGSAFEARWGSRPYLRFCLLSIVGAAILALPLGMLLELTGLFHDRDVFGGPDAAIDAMLVALTLEAPNASVLFGFVLPMRARSFLLALLGLELVGGIMTGTASMGLTLGGMAMGYLLVTGSWRPSVLLGRVRRFRQARRRRGLFVVPPPSSYPPRGRDRRPN